MKVAAIIRKGMADKITSKNIGFFCKYGSDSLVSAHQPSLSISQLILFNCYKCQQVTTSGIGRHTNREPSLPVFVGLKLDSKTRKSDVVDDMYKCGLSVSYKRVLEIENTNAHNLCENTKCS